MSYNAKSLNSGKRTPFTQDGSLLDCEATPAAAAVHDLQCGHSSGEERSLHTGKVRGSKPCARTKDAGVLSLFDRVDGPPPKVPTRPIPEVGISDRQRFRRMYERRSPEECWPWKGGTSGFGYGRFKICGRLYSSHRLAYTLAYGPIPTGPTLVLHSCDNPRCCNPSHLSLGTHKDNSRDASERNRHSRHSPPTKYAPDDEALRLIRDASLSSSEVGRRLGVHHKTIIRVRQEHGMDTAKYRDLWKSQRPKSEPL